MDELIFSGELLESSSNSDILPAVVTGIDSEGIGLSVNGGLENLKKKYGSLQTGYSYSIGDRVLVARVSGTYLVLGKIAT